VGDPATPRLRQKFCVTNLTRIIPAKSQVLRLLRVNISITGPGQTFQIWIECRVAMAPKHKNEDGTEVHCLVTYERPFFSTRFGIT
jgi:hypothetical protein